MCEPIYSMLICEHVYHVLIITVSPQKLQLDELMTSLLCDSWKNVIDGTCYGNSELKFRTRISDDKGITSSSSTDCISVELCELTAFFYIFDAGHKSPAFHMKFAKRRSRQTSFLSSTVSHCCDKESRARFENKYAGAALRGCAWDKSWNATNSHDKRRALLTIV